ncbi:unnamed protein product [Danaus chrysippus]|uniref:protein-histidine N-methyltransferase n=1 Tax=Danaus chrysippus TaxID=151541 RepID=A0A8J2W091_9NEOP|nr:unnamed protein product [Danaus chrysippus]
MASFKFNFSGESEDENRENGGELKDVEWLDSEEVIPNSNVDDLDELVEHAKMFTCGCIEIGHVLIDDIFKHNINKKNYENILNLAEKEHSDLVSGKYEGGLKIWECTYDLVEYFENNPDAINFKDMKVLDLGCGAGILGIYAFLKGATVTFQDYNKEILELSTITNVLLNIEESGRDCGIKNFKFYSGDWASFDKLLASEKFDIILTSETIYNQNNYEKLIKLFENRLNVNGVVYVAAKTYYFGVGGGTRQFETAVHKSSLKSEVVWKTSSGIQREIIKITNA